LNNHITVKAGDSEGFLENDAEFWIIVKISKNLIKCQICTQPFTIENLKEICPTEIGNPHCWFRIESNHQGKVKYTKALNVE
jgi:Zn finger protein HypA/HybF involved in hydrogenase expression